MSFHENCQCCNSATSVNQTLSEMDWERGIWNAALSNDVDRLQHLIGKGVDPGLLDNAGYTALHYAARAGHLAACQLLLDCGAPIDAQTRAGGATALHRAATSGKTAIALLLLGAGASMSLQDSDGQTPLHRAAENGNMDIIEAIIKKSPDLRSVLNYKGRTPLMCLPSHAKENLITILK